MIQRRTTPKRSALAKPRKRIAAQRPTPRRVSALRDEGYLEFPRESPCAVSGQYIYRNEPAHGPVNGMRSKGPDNEAIPLTAALHREQHRLTWPTFELKYGISRARIADEHWQRYLVVSGKLPPAEGLIK